MIWSTITDKYLQCVSESDNGSITGKWSHIKPLFTENGGHGMVFKDMQGRLKLTLHCPNQTLYERPVFFELRETEQTIEIQK